MNLYPKVYMMFLIVTYYDSKGYIKETCFWGGVGETIQRREMSQNKGKTTGKSCTMMREKRKRLVILLVGISEL